MESAKVFLVEDDCTVCDSITWMLAKNGIDVCAFGDPQIFLEKYDPEVPGCLILDLNLPRMDGISVAEQLAANAYCPPYILISGQAEVCDVARAMKCGAMDFIEKPLDCKLIVSYVQKAFRADEKRRASFAVRNSTRNRLEALSDRERQVLSLVMAGKLSKQIASQLKISIKTVETHRANITRKMHVDSIIQAVCMVASGWSSRLDPPYLIEDEAHHASEAG